MEVLDEYIQFGRSREMFDLNFNKMSENKKKNLLAILDDFNGTRIELFDHLYGAACGNESDYEIFPLGIVLSFRPDRKVENEVVKRRVKGPYPVEMYNDPVFVEDYVDLKYNTRVADVKSIVSCISGDIYALGDGAGVCYRAVQDLVSAGHNVRCFSFDNSIPMLAEAVKRDNLVKFGEFDVSWIPLNATIFLSHVTDYLPFDFFEKNKNRRLIVFDRNIHFQGCQYLKPYKLKWGYQICSVNVELFGIIPVSTLMHINDFDYSVLGIFLNHNLGVVEVDNSCAEYAELLSPYVTQLYGFKRALISTGDFQNEVGTIIAMPYFGVIDSVSACIRGIMPIPEYQQFFLDFGGYFSRRPSVCSGSVTVCGREVYARVGMSLLRLDIKGNDLKYITAKKKYDSIEIVDCRCWGQASHHHILTVVHPENVEILNVINDVRRLGYSLIRTSIINYYCTVYTDSELAIVRRTNLLNKCQFTEGGRYKGLKTLLEY